MLVAALKVARGEVAAVAVLDGGGGEGGQRGGGAGGGSA